MTAPGYSSFMDVCQNGPRAPHVRAVHSVGDLDLFESVLPPGVLSEPPVPDLVLHQSMVSGSRVSGKLGCVRFDMTSDRGGLLVAAPNLENTFFVDQEHPFRSLAFPMGCWKSVLEEAAEGQFSLDFSQVHQRTFGSVRIRSAMQRLWRLRGDEEQASRLRVQAAGYEILGELCRLSGSPLTLARGGLASWAERRCVDMMRARLSEDITLDELAAEARLSPFHFARMFKQRLGVPPREYLVRLRVEKACELLETTNHSIGQIARQVGYSSSQVLSRVFVNHRQMSPSAYRRAVRNSSPCSLRH